MNRIEAAFFGRVGQPPELRTSQAGKPWARLSIAVGQGDEDAEWLSVAVFGDLAKRVSNTLHKGDRVYVEGTLKLERWTKDGAERCRLSVAAWKCERLGGIGRNRPRKPNPSRAEERPVHGQDSAEQSDWQRPLDAEIPFAPEVW
jgi:single-strand DNA-binding protein